MRTRALFTDRFVCVVREDHPVVRSGLTVEQYAALEHVQVSPRGKAGGWVDDALAARGTARKVARAVPYFMAALLLVAETDYVATMSERVATTLGPRLRVRVLPSPITFPAYTLSMLWHPRMDGDAGHAWL